MDKSALGISGYIPSRFQAAARPLRPPPVRVCGVGTRDGPPGAPAGRVDGRVLRVDDVGEVFIRLEYPADDTPALTRAPDADDW